jgi:hypothetical protein
LLSGLFGALRGTEGAHLKDLSPPRLRVDVNESESTADDSRVWEDLPDPAREGIGGDIEILGLPVGQQIPYGSSDYVGLESRASEAPDYRFGIGVDQLGINAVIFRRVYVCLFYWFPVSIGAVAYKQVAIVQVLRKFEVPLLY